MTKTEENNKYYQAFLVDLGFTAEQIHIMLSQFPIDKTPVQPNHRKEGQIAQSITSYHKGEEILLLYRTNDQKWVGISSYNKIISVETKYFTRKYYRLRDPYRSEMLNFIKQHFPILEVISNTNSKASNGEILIKTALEKSGFNKSFTIVSEYQVPDLIGFEGLWERSPRYDFAILDNNKPLMFLEFDGNQHYSASKDFLRQFKRDKAKDAYAFYKSIPLIRFPSGVLAESDNVNIVLDVIKIYLSAGKFMENEGDN